MKALNPRLLFARILALLFAALFCFASCARIPAPPSADAPIEPPQTAPDREHQPALSAEERTALLEALAASGDQRVSRLASDGFLSFFETRFGAQTLRDLYELKDAVSSESLYALCDSTAVVLYDLCHGLPENVRVIESPRTGACIRVVGDVSFADNWKIIPVLEASGEGIEGVVSKEVLALLRSADVTLVNNEFTYSTRGAPLKNKAYTFRADPGRVELIKQIGANLVGLANNHAYDYGADAFADTLETLQNANLPYIGGGKDVTEASRPFYYIVNGRKYAFSAATRAEKYILTPEATQDSSGVLRTYDPTAYLEVIARAEENCDTNVVYVHWGTEDSHATEDGLYELASQYIDAGADVVIGAHAHVLQGVDYYKNVPIVYNLGNFLFNAETTETGILELQFDEHGALSTRLIPCMQENCTVRAVYDGQAGRVLDLMRSLSPNVSFTDDGAFCQKAET